MRASWIKVTVRQNILCQSAKITIVIRVIGKEDKTQQTSRLLKRVLHPEVCYNTLLDVTLVLKVWRFVEFCLLYQ